MDFYWFFQDNREFQPKIIFLPVLIILLQLFDIKIKEYKITRPMTSKELYQQIPKVKEVLSAFNVLIFEKESFEVNDLI